MMKNEAYQFLKKLGVLGLSLACLVGCTRTQIHRAVVDTNAAIIAPYQYQASGGVASGGWEAPARQLNHLIAANSGEKALVAGLQLRKAVLYTTYKKFAFAASAWNGVTAAGGESALRNARDKTLYRLRNEMTWAFKDFPPFGSDLKMARNSSIPSLNGVTVESVLTKFQREIDGAKSRGHDDLQHYLATLKFQLELKAGGRLSKETKRPDRALSLTRSFEAYASHFEAADFAWLFSGADSSGIEPGSLRHRSHLKQMWKTAQSRIRGMGPFTLTQQASTAGASQFVIVLKQGETRLHSFAVPAAR